MNQDEQITLLLNRLPKDIKFLILKYTTKCSIHKDKAVLKLNTDDERYKILSKIPKIEKNFIYLYESNFGCKTIVHFWCGAQLMYCNDENSFLRKGKEPTHSILFRMRKRREYPEDYKWKTSVVTKIL